ncbi:MAG: type II secretion system protein [Planctomycetes bacterium]|nr:type II secretion system protein [Planctomycetota bacterium]
MTLRRNMKRTGFTLIEMLVVVAIIALLVGILLPSFGAVRRSAKKTQTLAQFNALAAGLELFRKEQTIGGSLPPSASDNPDDFMLIANPRKSKSTANNNGQDSVRITGAHLLFQAMVGADQLGTPGFRDRDRDGEWWNNTHDTPKAGNNPAGLYAIDPTTGKEEVNRFGGAGYVDDKMTAAAQSLDTLDPEGLSAVGDAAVDEPMFVESFGMPILYYRANRSLYRMTTDVTDSTKPGIYRQQDNALITGAEGEGTAYAGLDFGPGEVDGRYHAIKVALSPAPNEDEIDVCDTGTNYVDSFARFICDHSIRARPTPVRRDSYLLISAGPDNRYGTEDDITNWDRKPHE